MRKGLLISRRLISPAMLLVLLAACAAPAQRISAPDAVEQPVEKSMHGETRIDEYVWLEEKGNPEVEAYLLAENDYAQQSLAHTQALQETLYEEMVGRIAEDDASVPYRRGNYVYYTRIEKGDQYPRYYRQLPGRPESEMLLLDLNALAAGKTFMSMWAFEVSDDARWLAYSTDETGYRQYRLFMRNLTTGEVVAVNERVTSAAWAADNATLFYTTEDPVTKRSNQFFSWNRISGEHVRLYEETDERFGVYTGRSKSGELLFRISESHTTSEAAFLAADDPQGDWTTIEPRRAGIEYYPDHRGDDLFIRVNDEGRNFRLVKTPVAAPGAEHWATVVPHRENVLLDGIELFADHLVLIEREGGKQRLRVMSLAEGEMHDIAFPEPAYAVHAVDNSEFDSTVLRYRYESLVTPESVYDYDMNSRQATLMKQQIVHGYDQSLYTSERRYATARDGTQVPLSIVYRKGVNMDGSAPLLLRGYGSYGYSSTDGFRPDRVSLLDRGMVFAIAHIRGGSELGKAWHDNGRMASKMNTFTDFIDVARFLVNEKFTSADRLAAIGGSAGGLLMGAVSNLAPDQFAVVLNYVPFVDVLNTMLNPDLPLTVGEYEEWGNPNIKEQYDWIKAYSPYDNIGVHDYPAMLVVTSYNDSQVMYHEPAKYVARLRDRKTGDAPLYLVTNMGAGHGGASGRYDQFRELALHYAFLLDTLDAE